MGSLSPSPNLMCLVVIRMTCFYKLLFNGRLIDRFFLSIFFRSKLRPAFIETRECAALNITICHI